MKQIPPWFNEFLLFLGIVANIVGLATAPRGKWIWAGMVVCFSACYLVRRIREKMLQRMASTEPLMLTPCSVRPSPGSLPLTEQQARFRDELAVAAYTLLLWEQLDNGVWAKSGSYRIAASASSVPLAKGSLSGSYISCYSILSAVGMQTVSAFSPLLGTIASLRAYDGTYRRLRRPVTGGTETFEPEPPRHAAGALLCRLLLLAPDATDEKTVEWISSQPLRMPWDTAFVARALRVWSLSHKPRLRIIAELLDTLVPGEGERPADFWRQSDISYFGGCTYQWCVLWALLPLLHDKALPERLRAALQAAAFRMVSYYASLCPRPTDVLPAGFDGNQQPRGQSVLGTCVALIAATACGWEELRHSLIRRFFESGNYSLASLPSVTQGDASEIEMYLSWGSLLQVCALYGSCVSDQRIVDVHRVLCEWRQTPRREPLAFGVLQQNLSDLPHPCLTEMHTAAEAVRRIYSVVTDGPQHA